MGLNLQPISSESGANCADDESAKKCQNARSAQMTQNAMDNTDAITHTVCLRDEPGPTLRPALISPLHGSQLGEVRLEPTIIQTMGGLGSSTTLSTRTSLQQVRTIMDEVIDTAYDSHVRTCLARGVVQEDDGCIPEDSLDEILEQMAVMEHGLTPSQTCLHPEEPISPAPPVPLATAPSAPPAPPATDDDAHELGIPEDSLEREILEEMSRAEIPDDSLDDVIRNNISTAAPPAAPPNTSNGQGTRI